MWRLMSGQDTTLHHPEMPAGTDEWNPRAELPQSSQILVAAPERHERAEVKRVPALPLC